MRSAFTKSLLAASLSVAAFVATATAQVTAASAKLITTATQGISLSQLAGAIDLGPLPVSEPLTIRIGLKIQNQAALAEYVRSITDPTSASYGESLTPEQFAATYAPNSAQVNAVVNFLQSSGFTNIEVEPNKLLVSADGTAAVAAAAFHTSFEKYSQFGSTVFGNFSAPQIPASLGPVVAGVLGLNTIGQMKPTIALPSVPVPQYAVSYTPKQLQHIYGGDGVKTATNASIAIMAEGDMTGVLKDLRIAEKAFGLPQVPVTVVQVGVPSPDVAALDEWDMDTQYSSGLAGSLRHLYLYATTSLSDSDLALEFSRWATDNKAKAASASLGECEFFPFLDGSMVVDHEIFLEAAAQGQTFFASSGDTGSFCPVGVGTNGVPAGAPFVSYPAASSYVVGVGGTTLLTNADGSYDKETSWYAGGGGLSQFETAPFWQQGAVTVLSKTGTRGVPDIAYDADPESGATVYVNGAPIGVGGTSLSSPMALGVWARAVSINPKLGFASPRIYGLYDGSNQLGSYPKGGFHDITVGANGLYPAGPGYDLNTGLGTPIIGQFTSALSK